MHKNVHMYTGKYTQNSENNSKPCYKTCKQGIYDLLKETVHTQITETITYMQNDTHEDAVSLYCECRRHTKLNVN